MIFNILKSYFQFLFSEGSEPGDESIREMSVDLGRIAELKCSLEPPVTWRKVQGIISRDSSMKEVK